MEILEACESDKFGFRFHVSHLLTIIWSKFLNSVNLLPETTLWLAHQHRFTFQMSSSSALPGEPVPKDTGKTRFNGLGQEGIQDSIR